MSWLTNFFEYGNIFLSALYFNLKYLQNIHLIAEVVFSYNSLNTNTKMRVTRVKALSDQ